MLGCDGSFASTVEAKESIYVYSAGGCLRRHFTGQSKPWVGTARAAQIHEAVKSAAASPLSQCYQPYAVKEWTRCKTNITTYTGDPEEMKTKKNKETEKLKNASWWRWSRREKTRLWKIKALKGNKTEEMYTKSKEQGAKVTEHNAKAKDHNVRLAENTKKKTELDLKIESSKKTHEKAKKEMNHKADKKGKKKAIDDLDAKIEHRKKAIANQTHKEELARKSGDEAKRKAHSAHTKEHDAKLASESKTKIEALNKQAKEKELKAEEKKNKSEGKNKNAEKKAKRKEESEKKRANRTREYKIKRDEIEESSKKEKVKKAEDKNKMGNVRKRGRCTNRHTRRSTKKTCHGS